MEDSRRSPDGDEKVRNVEQEGRTDLGPVLPCREKTWEKQRLSV